MKKLFAVLLTIGVCVLPTAVFGKTMTVEAEATTVLSPEAEVVTAAAAPSLTVAATGREGELRLTVDNDGDPAGTQFAIKEISGNKYVNPFSGVLQAEPAWGVHEDWGSDQGVIVKVGSLPAPSFVGMAKNLVGETTVSARAVSLSGHYRASRDPFAAVMEGVMYGIGILAFAGLAVHQFLRMRSSSSRRKSGSRKR